MADGIKRITGRELKQRLHDGDEIALLDAREEGVFARRHLLMASGVPLSRLELLIDDLVPRRTGAIPLVVTTHDGRPTKIDGNPLHRLL